MIAFNPPSQDALGSPAVLATRELLGREVVLLPVPLGKKGPTFNSWNATTLGRMDDPGYLAQFTDSNIGVLLGKVSGNLCSIDVDSDEDFKMFLNLNPPLAVTLQTRGARGGNVWLKVVGDYPFLTKVKKVDGTDWGEFRSDGGQTIIHGVHPNGMNYRRLVDAKPVELEFDDIIWPGDLILPWTNREYDQLVEKEGEPFPCEGDAVRFNEPAIVEKFLRERISLYESNEGAFYQYEDGTGLWVTRTDDEIRVQFSDDLNSLLMIWAIRAFSV